MTVVRGLAPVLLLLLAMLPAADAQGVTGQITGTVIDSTGGVVSGAPVRLIHDLSKQEHNFTTDSNGLFIFTGLVPGAYSLHIALAGFKAYDQTGINLTSQERLPLGNVRLEVGDVTSTVVVQADAARVATDSSDRSILVNETIIGDTPSRGRDFVNIMRSLPGVQVTSTNDRPGVSGPPLVNGGSGQFLVTLDGTATLGFATQGTASWLTPSVDAIAEVKVLVSNYQAEYGARAGGQMNVVFKNGTNQFHGSAYYFWRHEQFNANEWFNNKNGVAKPMYRYQNPGGTIGGPLLIPGTRFNKSRTKLFFFFSEDYLHTRLTGAVNHYNMPTALERSGDFSQTVTSTGVLIPIKDPTTGNPYPGNKMPASQINPIGSAMMNLFPLPFTTDPSGLRQFNTQYQFIQDEPREDRVLRLDYSLGPKTTSYVRLMQDYQNDEGVGASLGGGGGWGQFSNYYAIPAVGAVFTAIHIFRPNLVNETMIGINRAHQMTGPTDQAAFTAENDLSSFKGANGQPLTLPHFFSGNYLDLIPEINFGTTGAQSAGQAVTAPPGFSYDSRWPWDGTDQLTSLTNNVSWIKGSHNTKFGFYMEHSARNVSVYSTYNTAGTYWFGSDTANPNDTGYAYSNLLYGAVQAYGEDNKKQTNHAGYNQVEWFAQDTWKIHRRLTLDVGMRFQVIEPAYSRGATLGLFSGPAYNASQSGQLLYPALVNGQKVAINPLTGATYPFPRATSFDPLSYPSGNSPYSGIVQYHTKFFNTPPVLLGPRVGLAWDVFGNGRTAVRSGFGIFYGRAYSVDTIGATSSGTGPMAAPPAFQAPIFYNTTFSSLLQTQGWFGTQNVNSGSQDFKNPSSYQWSFGIQQDLRHGLILDVAYVGNVAHHGFGTTNDANAVLPLTDWTPQGGAVKKYLDPTSSGGGTGAFYATNLIRAMVGYQGYGTISTFTSNGESYYNSLQVQVNRRFGKRLQFAANWTWEKNLTYSHQQWIPDDLTKNVDNTSPQAVNIAFGWEVPNGSRLWKNVLTKGLLDGWRLNGVGAFFMGKPMTISCTAQSAPIGWPNGTPTGGIPLRCEMVGNLWLPSGTAPPSTSESRLWYPFNAASFVLPPGTTLGFGDTPPTLTYGPGFENIDLAISKQFRIAKEASRVVEFRLEAFNALNHFNPSNPNTSLTLNYATGANTNAAFGTITSAQNNARRCAVSLKLRF